MRLFVCIKQVADTETRIQLKPDKQGVDINGTKWIINPYDEFAIEEAIRFKQSHPDSQITAITLGPKERVKSSLLTAMAMGVDDSILIDTQAPLDALTTAKALGAAIQQETDFFLIYAGKLSIDNNVSATPLMLAQILEVPHASMVHKINYDENDIQVCREVEGGNVQTFRLKLPALVTTNKGLNKPRFASLPGIMKAKKKPIKIKSLEELGLSADQNKVKFTNYEMPAQKAPCKMIKGEAKTQVDELVHLLQQEARVL